MEWKAKLENKQVLIQNLNWLSAFQGILQNVIISFILVLEA